MAETYITNFDTDVYRVFLLCKQIAGTSASSAMKLQGTQTTKPVTGRLTGAWC